MNVARQLRSNEAIEARVDPQHTLGSLTSLYDARLESVLHELAQNARRAGATCLEVRRENEHELVICDDGEGIAHPAALLHYGATGWSEAVREAEHPAGLGLLSLAARGARIASWPASRADGGWRAELTAQVFAGEAKAQVHAVPGAHAPGTEVRFALGDVERGEHVVRIAVTALARHFPLPVRLDGEPLERVSFGRGAIVSQSWEGLTLYVVDADRHGERTLDLNYYGQRVRADLPRFADAWGHGRLKALADVHACPALTLTLPTRERLVEGEFSRRLRERCLALVHRAAARRGCARAAHRDFVTSGGTLVPARPWLPAWEARPAHRMDLPRRWDTGPGEEDRCGPEHFVVPESVDTVTQAVLERALAHAGATQRAKRECRRYEGYEWYDRLPRVRELRLEASARGQALAPTTGGRADRAEALVVHVEFEGEHEALSFASDVWLEDPDGMGRPESVAVLCVAREPPDAEDLAHLIYDATFRYADYAGADGWDTQSDEAWKASRTRARKALWARRTRTREEASEAVREALSDCGWSRPGDEVQIRVQRDRIEVRRPAHDDAQAPDADEEALHRAVRRAARSALAPPCEVDERYAHALYAELRAIGYPVDEETVPATLEVAPAVERRLSAPGCREQARLLAARRAEQSQE